MPRYDLRVPTKVDATTITGRRIAQIMVTEMDYVDAKPGNPWHCAAKKAIQRTFDEAGVHIVGLHVDQQGIRFRQADRSIHMPCPPEVAYYARIYDKDHIESRYTFNLDFKLAEIHVTDHKVAREPQYVTNAKREVAAATAALKRWPLPSSGGKTVSADEIRAQITGREARAVGREARAAHQQAAAVTPKATPVRVIQNPGSRSVRSWN